MKWTGLAAASLVTAAIAAPAYAQKSEIIAIGNAAASDSQFYMLSYRYGLSGNVESGLRLRFDATRANYATNYDAIPGTGTVGTYRALLSYISQVSPKVALTFTGGVSYRTRAISPNTLNSPADFAGTGYFVSFEVYSASNNANDFQALVEYDSVLGTSYASMTYELNLGSFKAGPTANYILESDYSRTAIGVSASFNLSENIELKATTAWAEQTIGVNAPEPASYIELQIRTTF